MCVLTDMVKVARRVTLLRAFTDRPIEIRKHRPAKQNTHSAAHAHAAHAHEHADTHTHARTNNRQSQSSITFVRAVGRCARVIQ